MNWLTSRCAPLAALAALTLAGCDKGTDLNVDLPDTTAISTQYQDFSLDVATVRLSPVQTLKTDHYLVGRLADNIAGTTEARAYLNVVVGSSNDSLPSKFTAPILDSVAIVMGFDKVNGSSSTPVRFDVFSLQAPLDERQGYNSTSPAPATNTSTPLGRNIASRLDRTVQIVTDTSTTPDTKTAVADPTIRLVMQRTAAVVAPFTPAPAVPSPFFERIFNTALRGSSFTQAQLDAELKGVALEPSAGYSSSILSFGRSYNARLAFFFHNNGASTPALQRKWHSYSVFFGPVFSGGNGNTSNDPRYFTQIKNDLTSTPLSPLSDVTKAVPYDLLNGASYLQEGTGLGTRVTFKGLEQLQQLAAAGLTINRAEIRVPVKPFSNALFSNPSLIYAVEVDANNSVLKRTINFLPVDRVVQADGTDPLTNNRPATAGLQDVASTQPFYNLLITSYLQAYLTNKLDGNPASLVLVPNTRFSSSLSLNRAALDAAQVSLRVYYSKR
ncbi:DUF4270 family protein [Hymenobacter terrenus]|uniref:DUF4270 family protein n=1 Tax=Hymenobacter terrenus TaxID=1629124 RepID=UPI000619B392|nr:DUF4270 family protein [Hymenobacter terrenus]